MNTVFMQVQAFYNRLLKATMKGERNMKYESEIRRIINENISNICKVDLRIDDNLEEKGMDSLCFIKIIVDIEKECGINFPEYDLLPSKMNTIRNFCNEVNRIKY
ncbi:MAG: acyl carrier protein [Sellimonas intestinalis]|uniref:acyl carrier protein n=1 Tax=Sellimonas intestinalis TaxID=1653434 RepID=UPI003995D042